MQCIKESSTLRVSTKNDKPPPRIVLRVGKQDDSARNFLQLRKTIKRIDKLLAQLQKTQVLKTSEVVSMSESLCQSGLMKKSSRNTANNDKVLKRKSL